MRLIQFRMPGSGRRAGLVEGDVIYDLTAFNPEWDCIHSIFFDARSQEKTIEQRISDSAFRRMYSLGRAPFSYSELLSRWPGEGDGWLLPPIDHPDPAHCIVSGTGLTHLGSTSQRDKMHKGVELWKSSIKFAQAFPKLDEPHKTDSQKMFEMGVEGGKPKPGTMGIQPEWFYKGTGAILRGHNDFLDIPSFTIDGGEEPEIAGCYIIGSEGIPYRLGFAVANEWSDHAMERVNYLWLAPSKLRTCAIGPELITDQPFKDIRGVCRIYRGDELWKSSIKFAQAFPKLDDLIYDSGELLTGEENMSHSLVNLEDHQFKYPQFRIPGDVHIHFFGTMKLSYGSRGPLQDGDRIEIHFQDMGKPLVNYVRRIPPESNPVTARKG